MIKYYIVIFLLLVSIVSCRANRAENIIYDGKLTTEYTSSSIACVPDYFYFTISGNADSVKFVIEWSFDGEKWNNDNIYYSVTKDDNDMQFYKEVTHARYVRVLIKRIGGTECCKCTIFYE